MIFEGRLNNGGKDGGTGGRSKKAISADSVAATVDSTAGNPFTKEGKEVRGTPAGNS